MTAFGEVECYPEPEDEDDDPSLFEPWLSLEIGEHCWVIQADYKQKGIIIRFDPLDATVYFVDMDREPSDIVASVLHYIRGIYRVQQEAVKNGSVQTRSLLAL